MAGYGLIAGLSWTEMRDMLPGEVMDCYLSRREYDDAHFGVRRE